MSLPSKKIKPGILFENSYQSISRMLKAFQDAEIIKMDKNKITIFNDKKLEEIKLKG